MEMLGTAILIKPDELPERTETGNLVIPKNSKEMLPQWGTIIDHGKACKEVCRGMHVHFPRNNASVIVIDDQDYYITYEHRIFFMREKEEKK
jgi:co-chaperonin GroES (HSP10)